MAMACTWWVLTGVAGATTLTAPTISGVAQQGQTLTASPGTAGPSTDTFDAPTYQWLVCNPACSNGPTGASFPLTAAEVGATIEVTETVNDNVASPPAPNPASATSTPTAAVVPLPPANTTAPSIAGIVQQGQTLTANPGVWSPAATGYTYAWTSGGAPVGTGTQTYTVAPTDVGKAILVSIVASNLGGNSSSVASAPTSPVLPLAPGNLTLPTISGTPQQGQVLTLTQGTWANAPTSIADLWEDCGALTCTAIPGQTGGSYTVGAGDVGHTIQVAETAFNAAALTGVLPVASARTATVSATSTTSLVTFSQDTPTANQAVTLVATVSSSSGNANPHGSVSFLNGSSPVSGCANKGVSGGQTVTIVCQASFGAGVAQLSAAYAGDPTSLVADSVSDTTALSVGKAPTSISLAVTPHVGPGGRATYIATLQMPLSNAGPLLPSGSIEFLDGGQPIGACANQALSSNTATCSVSYPSVGAHSISARYGGDANFNGSASSASGVQIVQGAAKAPAVHAVLGSTLGWTIHYSPHYSWLSALTAFAVPKGAMITLQCRGKGCPFAKSVIKHASGRVDLARRFRHRHLRAGTRITVRVTRRGWVGKYYSFTIRAGHKPKVTTLCLAPGRVKPGVGCSSK